MPSVDGSQGKSSLDNILRVVLAQYEGKPSTDGYEGIKCLHSLYSGDRDSSPHHRVPWNSREAANALDDPEQTIRKVCVKNARITPEWAALAPIRP